MRDQPVQLTIILDCEPEICIEVPRPSQSLGWKVEQAECVRLSPDCNRCFGCSKHFPVDVHRGIDITKKDLSTPACVDRRSRVNSASQLLEVIPPFLSLMRSDPGHFKTAICRIHAGN
jgi:hypothetical protein